MRSDPYPLGGMTYDELDEDVELSIYALNRRQRRLMWTALTVSLVVTVALAICDPLFDIRLTIPALLSLSVMNLSAASLLFARRLMPVHAAFRYGYKSGRIDERVAWVGDQ